MKILFLLPFLIFSADVEQGRKKKRFVVTAIDTYETVDTSSDAASVALTPISYLRVHETEQHLKMIHLGDGRIIYFAEIPETFIGRGAFGEVSIGFLKDERGIRKIAFKKIDFEKAFEKGSGMAMGQELEDMKLLMYKKFLSIHEKFSGVESLHVNKIIHTGSFVEEGRLMVYNISELQDSDIGVPDLKNLIRSLLLALRDLVYHDISHNDIHAGNILLNSSGYCLIDFDLMGTYSSDGAEFSRDVIGILNIIANYLNEVPTKKEVAYLTFLMELKDRQHLFDPRMIDIIKKIEALDDNSRFDREEKLAKITELIIHPWFEDRADSPVRKPFLRDWPEKLKLLVAEDAL